MAFLIDYGVTGADQFVSKTKVMTNSVTALNGAWGKYQKSMAAGSIGNALRGAKGISSGAGIVQSLVAFSVVSRVMEKLMGDRLKDWFGKLVKSDIEKYKTMGRGIAKLTKPLTDNIKANARMVARGAKDLAQSAVTNIGSTAGRLGRRGVLGGRLALIGLLGRKPYLAVRNFNVKSTASALMKKAPVSVRLAVAEGAIVAKVAGRMFGPIISKLIKGGMQLLTKTPLSMLVAGPLFFAMLDSRVSEWLNKKIAWVVEKISNGISKAVEVAGSLWDGFTVGLARATNNAYYAKSQVDWKKAAQASTPEQQKQFMESEKKRLTEADLEEFVKAEFIRMNKFFAEENEKRAREIGKVSDMMIKQGRL